MNILTSDVYKTLRLHRQIMRETLNEVMALRKDVKPTSTQDHLRRMEYTGRLPKFSVMD